MPVEAFGFYSKDQGKLLKDFELGSELIRLMFWKDLLTARSRANGVCPSATMCDTIYKSFKKLFVLFVYLQNNIVKRGVVPKAAELVSVPLLPFTSYAALGMSRK